MEALFYDVLYGLGVVLLVVLAIGLVVLVVRVYQGVQYANQQTNHLIETMGLGDERFDPLRTPVTPGEELSGR